MSAPFHWLPKEGVPQPPLPGLLPGDPPRLHRSVHLLPCIPAHPLAIRSPTQTFQLTTIMMHHPISSTRSATWTSESTSASASTRKMTTRVRFISGEPIKVSHSVESTGAFFLMHPSHLPVCSPL